jgi:MbtH protein
MSTNDEDETQTYKVLVNIEEQYSFWPSFKKEIPYGWRETGVEGTKEVCGAYVKEVWTDMRPLSLRKQMEEANQKN